MTRVAFVTGNGGLPKLQITTEWSAAEIYLHGAHVTQFQKHGEPPLLFLSAQSRFQPDAPIRGGIPIIFPWFGKPVGRSGQHGFARNRSWALQEITTPEPGTIYARFRLPPAPELGEGRIVVDFLVSVGQTLTAELKVTNHSTDTFDFENCLHTYFAVGDISTLQVVGLQGVDYLDSLEGHQRKTEVNDAIRFTGEVDRTFINTRHRVEIHDPAWRRRIRVEKTGGVSTVVWNPWIAKAKAMTDFGNEEYQRMVCVESGNVATNQITLAPDEAATLTMKLSSEALA